MERHKEYQGMQHRFNMTDLLLDPSGRQGGSYPAMPSAEEVYHGRTAADLVVPDSPALLADTTGGTPIRREDALGRRYFMPVWVRSSHGEMELPCAVISVTGKKRIVETPLVGRRGTVNELISVDSYEVSITATLVGKDGNYPEEEVKRMRALYELNEAVELISALTDMVFEQDDKVVITKIDFPAMRGVEDVQIVKLMAHTDAAIALIIE